MPRRIAQDTGQGTIEYVAILALVTLVLATAVAGAAVLAPGVANAVVGKVRHGLCVVTGQTCAEVAERACVVRSARDAKRETLSIAFVHVGAGRVVLREELSDGRVRLTVLRQGLIGATAGTGGRGRVKIGRTQIDVGTHANATLAGIVGRGKVYEADGDQAADALVERMRVGGSPTVDAVRHLLPGDDDDAPPPDATFWEGGAEGDLDGSASRGDLSAGGGLERDGVLGRRVDERTGETTYYLRLHAGLSVFGDAMLATGGAALDGDAMLAVTTDRAGRPKELTALVGGHGEAGIATSGDLAIAMGDHGARIAGFRWEAEAHVSLSDPEVRDAFAAWQRHPTSTDAVLGLGNALRSRARIDVRRYARDGSSDSDGLSGSAGVRFAFGVDHDTESMRLQSAVTRPPGGLWERRLDCLG